MLRDVQHRVAANEAKMPYEWLERKWKGAYDPKAHLFRQNEEDGFLQSIYAMNSDVWSTIGAAYCRFHLRVWEHEVRGFWQDMQRLCRETGQEYRAASPQFREWLSSLQ